MLTLDSRYARFWACFKKIWFMFWKHNIEKTKDHKYFARKVEFLLTKRTLHPIMVHKYL